ncbi:sigma 54-interacting transcriptional regulator [uncultured Mailhella sp.]|uniref:sigma-54 interaction domain-containing protein n=1 Tax=uncultured Mailhella sp. TaxID=1981031 RepID=UPI0025D4A10A|nr:sigma 54-interacting transcriptional regulator [uncultured Mailhella sp.]
MLYQKLSKNIFKVPSDADCQEQVKNQWEMFIRGENIDKKVLRNSIYNSWKRSKVYNVNYQSLQTVIVPQKELDKAVKKNDVLISCSSVILSDIFYFNEDIIRTVILTDASGTVIDLRSQDDSVCLGMTFDERHIGTHGIATCRHEEKLITVIGNENYCIQNKNIACTASPVWNATRTHVLGFLGVIVRADEFKPFIRSIIEISVNAITEQIKAYTLLQRQNTLISVLTDGLIFLEHNFSVYLVNKYAKKLLDLDSESISKNIFDLMSFNSVVTEKIVNKTPFIDEKSVCVNALTGISITCVISMSISENQDIVLTFREVSRIKDLKKAPVPRAVYSFKDIVGRSPAVLETVDYARRAALNDFPVLLIGESGTGKELFAQSIHNASARSGKPFIAVNCGALPHELVQSELFGYSEGAFTGASRHGKAGKFELADGGTIFLDEIGEMPLHIQANLLRILQDGELCRIGGQQSRKINVKIIAATNRNLHKAIAEKMFREDLFYRLNVFNIHIPALRERMEDVETLANYFVYKISNNFNTDIKKIDDRVLEAFKKYSWPGNVRELENVITRAVYVCRCDTIRLEHIPSSIVSEYVALDDTAPAHSSTMHDFSSQSLYKTEEAIIRNILSQQRGNVYGSSKILNISRSSLYYKCAKYGIDPKIYK